MKRINGSILIAIAFAIALFLVETASAQVVVMRRNAPVLRTELPQQTQPQPRVETAKQLPEAAFAGTIRGTISWPVSEGLPPMFLGADKAYALPCGLFAIRVYARNASERYDLVGSESSTRSKSDDDKTFVCTYEVASLPLETKMLIVPEFMDSQLLKARWISDLTEDGFVTLPSGVSRILAGEGYVTLTRQTSTIERNFTLGRTRPWGRPPIY